MSTFLIWFASALAGDGRVEGLVRYGESGLGKIAVRVDGASTLEVLTGPEGAWTAVLPEGRYTVTVGVGTERVVSTVIDLAADGLVQVDAQLSAPPEQALAVRALPPADPAGATAALSGRVVTGADPLAGARVYARGWAPGWTTDGDGRFTASLPPGTWDLLVTAPGYETSLAAGATAPGGEVTVELWPTEDAAVAGVSVEVEAERIADGSAAFVAERQAAAGVTDVVSSGQMARAGDAEAASAMRRVTGLSVVGGKYVYVRGLGDRYSATTLNGILLPSPEPEKRVVPLDLFPVSLLDGVVVQKTFSPELPGEFGGGVVDVRTRSVPDHATFTLTLQGAAVAGTSFAEALDGVRGPTDWLGFGRAFRALPAAVEEATRDQPIAPQSMFSDGGFSPEELEALGEAFPNHWGTHTRTLPPDFGLSTAAGGRVPLGGAELGLLAGAVYQNGWSRADGVIRDFSVSSKGLTLSRSAEFYETRNTVRLGTMGTVALEWGAEDYVRSVTLFQRNSVASAYHWFSGDATGAEGEVVFDSENFHTGWLEQSFVDEQASAHVTLGPVAVEGWFSAANARTDEPDRREVSYGITDAGTALLLNGSSNELSFTALGEDVRDGGGALIVPLRLASGDGRIQAGSGLFTRNRGSETRRFSYGFQGTEGIDLTAAPEDIFTAENIGASGDDDPGFIEIDELTVNSDDYTARQRLVHGYLLADVPWTVRVRTMAGARVESSLQEVSTFERFSTETDPVPAELDTLDVLPAAVLTVGVGGGDQPDAMLVRLGYGRTVSRPELRELSAVPYYDYRTRRLNFGNPDLERATIDNVDLRWEWYPRPAETLSLGGFYKRFQDPIEAVVQTAAVSGSVGSFDNAASAVSWGAELELRQGLDVLADALRDFYVTGNATVVRSRVDLSETEGSQTSTERPLQGQSPYLFNVLLGYDNPRSKTLVNLVYNVAGPRITEVGTNGIPDSYALPVHALDALVTQGVGEAWKVRFKGANLLAWPVRERTGDDLSLEVEADWSVGLALTWTPL